MNRRGFLGVILAAAAAPAIVRVQSLMPVAPPRILVPEGLFTGELGVIEGFRFINENKPFPKNAGSTVKFRRFVPFTKAAMDRTIKRITEGDGWTPVGEYRLPLVLHPEWAHDLRAAGVRSGKPSGTI